MKQWTTKSGCRIQILLSGRSNVYLVSAGDKHFLVDTAVKSDWRKLNSRLKEILDDKDNVCALILTHTHYDHAQNASAIKCEYKAEIIVNKNEAEFLENGDNPEIKGTTLLSKFIAYAAKMEIGNYMAYPLVKADIIFEDKYKISDFGASTYIMHTPGHSQGSSCAIIDDGIALVGDAMVGIFKKSIFPPFAQNTDELIKSWGKLLETGCNIFLPGHGTPISRELLQKEYTKFRDIMNRN